MLSFGVNISKTTKSKCSICKKEVTIGEDIDSGYYYTCICGNKEYLGKIYNEKWEGDYVRTIVI